MTFSILRALSTPSRHLQRRQRELFHDPSRKKRGIFIFFSFFIFTFPLCCKIHFQPDPLPLSSWVSFLCLISLLKQLLGSALHNLGSPRNGFWEKEEGLPHPYLEAAPFSCLCHFPDIPWAPNPLNTTELDRCQSNIHPGSLLTPVFHKPQCRN